MVKPDFGLCHTVHMLSRGLPTDIRADSEVKVIGAHSIQSTSVRLVFTCLRSRLAIVTTAHLPIQEPTFLMPGSGIGR